MAELQPHAPDHTEADAAEERETAELVEESRADRAALTHDLKRFSITNILLILLIAAVVAGGALSAISANASADAQDSASAAKDSSEAAEEAAAAAVDLARDTQRSNQAASCRGQFSAQVTDARTLREDASAQLLIALAEQASGALAGVEVSPDAFTAARQQLIGSKSIADQANTTYQFLIAAERDSPAAFRRLCQQGPAPLDIPD